MVYADELVAHPVKVGKLPAGTRWCHLTADTLEELHKMAQKIGMNPKWFQNHPDHPHYDLTSSRRAAALRAGAIFVPGQEQVRKRLIALQDLPLSALALKNEELQFTIKIPRTKEQNDEIHYEGGNAISPHSDFGRVSTIQRFDEDHIHVTYPGSKAGEEGSEGQQPDPAS